MNVTSWHQPDKGPIPSSWTLCVLFLQVDDDAPIMIFYNGDGNIYHGEKGDKIWDDDYDMMMVMPVMMVVVMMVMMVMMQWW